MVLEFLKNAVYYARFITVYQLYSGEDVWDAKQKEH